MRYGNCLIGVLVLFAHFPKGKLVFRWSKTCFFPHIGLLVNNKVYHYRVKKDILPFPFYWVVFEGKFDIAKGTNAQKFSQ